MTIQSTQQDSTRCNKCGKSIPSNSEFCMYCGTPLGNENTNTPTTWEYDDFVITYNHKGRWGFAWSTPAIARDYWQNLQANILPEIQGWLDKGWEPISEIGPSGFKIDETSTFIEKLFDQPMRTKTLVEFRVKMRRRK